MNYSFTLRVSGIEPTDNYEDRFYEAGCSDALVAVVNGTIFLDFDREAANLESAVQSAQRDIARAGGRVDEMILPEPR